MVLPLISPFSFFFHSQRMCSMPSFREAYLRFSMRRGKVGAQGLFIHVLVQSTSVPLNSSLQTSFHPALTGSNSGARSSFTGTLLLLASCTAVPMK